MTILHLHSATAETAARLRSAPASRPRTTATDRIHEPWWSRPGLVVVTVLAGVLVFWALTRNGYANGWYADGVLAASRSWRSLWDNSADLSNVISLDKGPLADWMMGLSSRLLGFSSFSMLLPDALCGVAAVVILHDAVRRTLGHREALLAALVLALSPVSVVMDRDNNPDALLALLLVAGAWALIRALESGRLRHMLLCGAVVGLAFNTKMLEAYLIVPGLAVAFMVAGRGGWVRRAGHLMCAAAVMVVVSFAWFATMMLTSTADRPFVANTTDDSWFSLMFGWNGLDRLRLSSRTDIWSSLRWASLTRLFTGVAFGGQIGWLLLFALAGLLTGLLVTRRAPRSDRRRAGYLLFGLWGLAGFAVFSFSQGIIQPYYTNAFAPAVAALVGAGAVTMWDRSRGGWGWAAALAATVAVTAALSFALLLDTPSFAPWLRWAVLAAAALAVTCIVAPRALAGSRSPERSSRAPAHLRLVSGLAFAAAIVALLGGPTAYSIATVGHGQADGAPSAGPGRAVEDNRVSGPLVAYLTGHRDGARYLVAATGAQDAAPIALAARAPVITLGGFLGIDPAPTLHRLTSLIAGGRLRYVIPAGPTPLAGARGAWVRSHCRAVTLPGGTRASGVCLCTPAEVTGGHHA